MAFYFQRLILIRGAGWERAKVGNPGNGKEFRGTAVTLSDDLLEYASKASFAFRCVDGFGEFAAPPGTPTEPQFRQTRLVVPDLLFPRGQPVLFQR